MSPPQDTPCDIAFAAVVVSSDPKSHHDGGGDDDMDTPAQPPSAVPDNNPSRPSETTYYVSLPVHELNGGGGGGGHDDRADDRPPKKRPATSSSCSGEDDESSPPSLPPKKRKVVDYCVDSFGSNGGRNRETPAVTRHSGGGAPAGSTAMDPALAKELRRRAIKFGKRKVTVELELALTVPTTNKPPKEKLMHDGIRAAAAAATPRLLPPLNRRIMHVPPPPPAAAMNGQLHNDDIDNMSVELRDRLDALGATAPRYVCKKSLKRSDVDLNQNRLLISCKTEEVPKCPITHLFTEEERIIVNKKPDEPTETRKKKMKNNNNDDEENPGLKVKKNNNNINNNEKPGLKVTMLDHGGDMYATTCRYLTSNGGYRFIGEWGKFLRNNGLAVSVARGEEWTRSVHVRLLEFRSRRLPQADKSGHPDGALGFVVLHGEDSDSDVDEDDQWKGKAPPPANAKKKKKSSNSKEHVKATTSSKSAVAVKHEVAAERVTRRTVEPEADDDDERMQGALNGMLKLSEGSPRSSSKDELLDSKPSSDEEEKAEAKC
uniref:Uncharacterized protein n=1 Tax=Oryza punctata TaxID=4537 RepID=A0A0E0LTB1_ORYPU